MWKFMKLIYMQGKYIPADASFVVKLLQELP
jgi:hypothetical protein